MKSWKLLKKRIAGFEASTEETEIGKVIQAGDGIAQVWGLDSTLSGELVEVEVAGGRDRRRARDEPRRGYGRHHPVLGLRAGKEGDTVRRTNRVAEVPVGEDYWGGS